MTLSKGISWEVLQIRWLVKVISAADRVPSFNVTVLLPPSIHLALTHNQLTTLPQMHLCIFGFHSTALTPSPPPPNAPPTMPVGAVCWPVGSQ